MLLNYDPKELKSKVFCFRKKPSKEKQKIKNEFNEASSSFPGSDETIEYV